MRYFLILITLILFPSVSLADNSQQKIIERFQYSLFCQGVFANALWHKGIKERPVIYQNYHGKAASLVFVKIKKPVFKYLKKNNKSISDDVWNSKIKPEFNRGQSIIDKFMIENDVSIIPSFEENNNANNPSKISIIEGSEPSEMKKCREKYQISGDELLTTGVFNLKIKKERVNEIVNWHINGFPDE